MKSEKFLKDEQLAVIYARKVYKEPHKTEGHHAWRIDDIRGTYTTVISIAGSNDRLDWRMNFKFWPAKFAEGIRVHRGFAKASREIFTAIYADVMDRLAKGHLIIFTGHSMGGAVSRALHLSFARFAGSTGGKIHSVSFGAPKLFFTDDVAPTPHVRVYHEDDPVTKIPSPFYSHRDYKTIRIEDEGGWDTDDHHIAKYYDFIMKGAEA